MHTLLFSGHLVHLLVWMHWCWRILLDSQLIQGYVLHFKSPDILPYQMELINNCLSRGHDIWRSRQWSCSSIYESGGVWKKGVAAILLILFMGSLDPLFVGLRLVFLQFLAWWNSSIRHAQVCLQLNSLPLGRFCPLTSWDIHQPTCHRCTAH